MESSNNVNYLRFGNRDFFCPQMNPRSFFLQFLFVANEDLVPPKLMHPPLIDIICVVVFKCFFVQFLFVQHPNIETQNTKV